MVAARRLGLGVAAWALLAVAGGEAAATPPAGQAPRPASQPAAAVSMVVPAVVAALAYADAYADHPLVAEVRSQRTLTLANRELALRDELPADRALAVIDAVGTEAVRRQQLDRFVLIGIAGRLAVGLSGALHPDNVPLSQATARHALLLGWARTLADGDKPVQLLRRSTRLAEAGAVQLLERAAELAPASQAARLALATARVAAAPRADCTAWTALAEAARLQVAEPVRLAAAESALQWLKGQLSALPAACVLVTERSSRLDAALQLAPPVAEDAQSRGGRLPATAQGPERTFGAVFVLAAPLFKGWLDDPLVRNLALRTPLDETALAGALAADPTGDRSIAILNASLHNRRIGVFGHASLAWHALLRAKGLIDADEGQQGRLKISDLTPVEAAVLGYAYAIANRPASAAAQVSARDASPEALFAHARGNLPLGAVAGPLVMLGLQVDRETSPCQAATRAEALRVVAGKSKLPAAALQQLVAALQTVELGCKEAPPPVAPGQPAAPPKP